MSTRNPTQVDLLDQAAPDERAGFRLQRLELFNWGTFDGKVWHFEAGGETSLLTGDIGSGKSTVVDAVTTLLVAPQKISYNKAAGAEARERTVRSYVFGYYKAERSETGAGAKPVALRDANSYSVLLAHFFNEGYQQHVTLAQVFWMREQEGQPSRLCIVADQKLSITEHFSGFNTISELRTRLRRITKDIHDTFPPYQAAFRKRFGIQNDQALELFHQTVSMKSVGNLTDFVRQHMLQPFPVEERIQRLVSHVDDLTRAHEAVLRAKDQLRRLTPLVEDCDQYDALTAKVQEDRACRDALKAWFASQLTELLSQAISEAKARLEQAALEVSQKQKQEQELQGQRDGLNQDIARNGGERLERLRSDITRHTREKGDRERRAESYDRAAANAGLPAATDGQGFLANARTVLALQPRLEQEVATLRQQTIDGSVHFKELAGRQQVLAAEIDTLRQRKSNIPADFLRMRTRLCEALSVDEEALPFAGELMQVHPDERAWEGAIERVLRGFGTSLLVPEEHYPQVSKWVDQTHLGMRLVYHRVKDAKQSKTPASGPDSLVRKLEFKHESPLSEWVEGEVTRYFNPVCCNTLEEFRREREALTRNGQLKGGFKHTKDDRSRVDDRTRYVLGWANHEKLAALEQERTEVERQAQAAADTISKAKTEESRLQKRLEALRTVAEHKSFEDLDWRQSVVELQRLDTEQKALEKTSDVLRTLKKRLERLEKELKECSEARNKASTLHTRVEEGKLRLEKQLSAQRSLIEATSDKERSLFGRLRELHAESGPAEVLTVDNATDAESQLRNWLQQRIDTDDQRGRRLGEKIVSAMGDYRNAYPLETRETAATLEAADEFRKMLTTLRNDDLPRFERRFKELLNENTIREVANFQSQLRREREEITERIETINRSLRSIEFNSGRFIRLEAANATDVEVRDFQQDLRACTEGTLTGSGDETYSENKFLQVKKIIERFQGREGSSDLDLKWTRKVTDVRNWFTFSASERWGEDDREHEHYTDSGGKSGGQKEKLAYTVLAASLAYQFGLEWGESKSRSFRFVVIDEAFGRGSDDSATYGLELFQKLDLQLLVVTPLQKIHVIEPYVANVGFVSNTDGHSSKLRNLTIEQFREEKARRSA